jgi:sec-independent protein translocase protein TatB
MLDVGFSELLLLGIVALVVLGPEKLPHVARIAGAWVGRIRRTVSNMQAEIEREVAAQELKARLEKEYQSLSNSDLAQTLKQEAHNIDASFQDLQGHVRHTTHEISNHVSAAPQTPDNNTTVANVTAVSADTSAISKVELKGEQAYREWLAAQKPHRILPPETPAADTPDKSSP